MILLDTGCTGNAAARIVAAISERVHGAPVRLVPLRGPYRLTLADAPEDVLYLARFRTGMRTGRIRTTRVGMPVFESGHVSLEAGELAQVWRVVPADDPAPLQAIEEALAAFDDGSGRIRPGTTIADLAKALG